MGNDGDFEVGFVGLDLRQNRHRAVRQANLLPLKQLPVETNMNKITETKIGTSIAWKTKRKDL